MRGYASAMILLALAGMTRAQDAPKQSTVKEPEIRLELLKRAETDQKVRGAITKWMIELGNVSDAPDEAAFEKSLDPKRKAEVQKFAEDMERVDRENTAWLGEIVDRIGWPGSSLVGKDGALSAWILVQHADANPKFQRRCLDLMRKLPRNEVRRADLAYLTDRVLLAEGKKQVYGTQFTLVDGKCKPRPLADEANVDKRRAEMGLEPLAEYFRQAEEIYVGKPRK